MSHLFSNQEKRGQQQRRRRSRSNSGEYAEQLMLPTSSMTNTTTSISTTTNVSLHHPTVNRISHDSVAIRTNKQQQQQQQVPWGIASLFSSSTTSPATKTTTTKKRKLINHNNTNMSSSPIVSSTKTSTNQQRQQQQQSSIMTAPNTTPTPTTTSRTATPLRPIGTSTTTSTISTHQSSYNHHHNNNSNEVQHPSPIQHLMQYNHESSSVSNSLVNDTVRSATTTTTARNNRHDSSSSSSRTNHHHHNFHNTPPPTTTTPQKDDEAQEHEQRELHQQQQQLPVHAYRDEIIHKVLYDTTTIISTNDDDTTNDSSSSSSYNKVTFITAATGSGKSTQIPTYFLSLPSPSTTTTAGTTSSSSSSTYRRLIAVTQPRRVAAITLAQRVIVEQQQRMDQARNMTKKQQPPFETTATAATVSAQQLIGYRVRFQDTTNRHTTQLVYITDGMLLREAMLDPLLLQYHIIFLDEAHERSLPTDLLLSIVKQAYLTRRRKGQSTTTTHRRPHNDDGGTRKRNKGRPLYPPLHVVIMSATLQTHALMEYFCSNIGIGENRIASSTSNDRMKDMINMIDIPGRQFPVQILYTRTPQDDYIESALATILQIHNADIATTTTTTTRTNAATTTTSKNGDILVFLPGQEEIENMVLLLKQQLSIQDRSAIIRDRKNTWTGGSSSTSGGGDRVEVINKTNASSSSTNHNVVMVAGVMICVLYAALPPEAQLTAFMEKPIGCIRKIILATNIAETSVTIPSIKYVVDTGKFKCRFMMSNSNTGMECLSISDISQAQAMQRSGRAGRVESGICFRLYTELAYDQLAETSIPEILRVNLSQVILQLKGMGITDPTTFDFVTRPDEQSIIRAMKVLYAVSALDNEMNITEYGKKLAKLPLDPMYGHLLLQSVDYTCVRDMLTTVAVLSVENLLYRPSTGSSRDGDIDGSSSITSIVSGKATAAHKRFISHEGDIPTYLNVYNAWRREAIYVPPSSGGRKAQKKKLLQIQLGSTTENQNQQSSGGGMKQIHGEWCQQNFISGRALTRALNIRIQLQNLCERSIVQNGLGLDVTTTYGQNRERFFKCIASGLFLQAASRIKIDGDSNASGRGRSEQIVSSRGRYKTKVGNVQVSVHPTSSMFNRQPAPQCVVYTELVVTKKSYIRGVTQIREEWLSDVAPNFFRDLKEVQRTTISNSQ